MKRIFNVPVVAIVGDISGDVRAAYDKGIAGIFSINRIAAPFSETKQHARDDLYLTVDNLIRFITAFDHWRGLAVGAGQRVGVDQLLTKGLMFEP